jgi:hypothetical protein
MGTSPAAARVGEASTAHSTAFGELLGLLRGRFAGSLDATTMPTNNNTNTSELTLL